MMRNAMHNRLLAGLLLGSTLFMADARPVIADTKAVNANEAVSADGSVSILQQQLQQFFAQQYAGSDMQVAAKITTPAQRQPQCPSPYFTLPPNGRAWGNMSIAVNCNGQKSYIQAKIQVTGFYWVAAHNINSGSHITDKDVERREGRLDLLPPRAIVDSKQAINAVTLRTINIGQPLTLPMLRRPWMVQAGQNVQVVANGGGFNVTSTGKAMNNAAAQDNVRVRMPSGQIINGTVGTDGSVSLVM
ncbi:flagellar basal body P-ring formation chaperone FlgA [Rouxiella sp. Mn2063]|uniref:flagellar basal body P-ring formation chaperone FlgA n=1 Tax=Rouxiella sp. Mn2063 TaxID=3395262 RepID=UPI003BE70428